MLHFGLLLILYQATDNVIQDWNEPIADLGKLETELLNQKQNSKDLQVPPSSKDLHNFNFPTLTNAMVMFVI